MGADTNGAQKRGGEDTRMIQPLNTNKSSPRSRGGGSPILLAELLPELLAELLAEAIPQLASG
jgi:hypothetical protein